MSTAIKFLPYCFLQGLLIKNSIMTAPLSCDFQWSGAESAEILLKRYVADFGSGGFHWVNSWWGI